jgi:hypothetical protein
VMCLLLFDWV